MAKGTWLYEYLGKEISEALIRDAYEWANAQPIRWHSKEVKKALKEIECSSERSQIHIQRGVVSSRNYVTITKKYRRWG